MLVAQPTEDPTDLDGQRPPITLGKRSNPPTTLSRPPSPAKDEERATIVERMQSLVFQAQKEALWFNGESDPLEWLREFKRVAAFNGHSESQMLSTAPFFLAGEALDWFDLEAEDLDRWESFEEKFRAHFVDSARMEEEARGKLKNLVYENGSSFTGYLDAVLKLCRKLATDSARRKSSEK